MSLNRAINKQIDQVLIDRRHFIDLIHVQSYRDEALALITFLLGTRLLARKCQKKEKVGQKCGSITDTSGTPVV